jgi:hypothetical protein
MDVDQNQKNVFFSAAMNSYLNDASSFLIGYPILRQLRTKKSS